MQLPRNTVQLADNRYFTAPLHLLPILYPKAALFRRNVASVLCCGEVMETDKRSSNSLDWSLPALAVDDSPLVANLASKMLRAAGFAEAQTCNSAIEALAKLRMSRWGLLLTDLEMPGMTGLDLIHCVRGDPGLADLPIILMTGHLELISRMVSKHQQSGADIHIIKPFTVQSLTEKIQRKFRCAVAASTSAELGNAH